MNEPLVTVIMAVHNGQDFLAECIESILAQTLEDFEFIIVDDASTDRTVSVIQDFALGDSRIRYVVNDVNSERSISRNRAVALATSELIAVMDADDVAMPDRLEKQVLYMRAHPEIAVLGGAMVAYETKVFMGVPFSRMRARLLFDSVISHPTCMFRKPAFMLVGQYDPSLPPAEDYGLWVSMANAGYQLANLPDVLIRYRTYPDKPRAGYREDQRLSVHKTWCRQLECMGVEASCLDLDVHGFCANSCPEIPWRIKQAKKWLAKLQAANVVKSYIDPDELENECAAIIEGFPAPLVLTKNPILYALRIGRHLSLAICFGTGPVGKLLERSLRSFRQYVRIRLR